MRKQRKGLQWEMLPRVHPSAAGLDIGAREIWVCVPSDRDPEPVRRFGTFTPDLIALVDWLGHCGVETVAMEATGVYWIPVFELLEARDVKAFLVNAQHLKRVPGRKSDYLDCQPALAVQGGFRSCIRLACWRRRCARTRRCAHCALTCATGRNCSSTGRRISCICRRLCTR